LTKTPASYPYLRIARRYGLSYEFVLSIADKCTHQGCILPDATTHTPWSYELSDAVREFKAIQDGTLAFPDT